LIFGFVGHCYEANDLGKSPIFPETHGAMLARQLAPAAKAGIRGLWCGAPANVARAALLSAGQLATYDQTKQAAEWGIAPHDDIAIDNG
jgi:hypothetical protein